MTNRMADIISMSALSVVGILGNLVVIFAISGDKMMRKSVMNILLMNLAIADLSNLIFTVPEWTSIALNSGKWILPDVMCPVSRYLEIVFLFTSISTQLIVCIERYIAIVLPMQARHLCSRRNAALAIFIAWLFAAIFATPYAALSYMRNESCSLKQVKWWNSYKLAEFLLFYFIPCLCISGVYTKVAAVLWAKDPTLNNEARHCLEKPKTSSRSSDALRTRRNVVKMLIACVAVYFICYSPIQFIFVAEILFDFQFKHSGTWGFIFSVLAMTCSASNPLLYTLFSTKFRRRLRDVIYCQSSKSHQKQKELLKRNYVSINNTTITATRASFN
ncbi:unnamed protein product [Caenorhabditis angaria]|uniref:G-protein coupled receptors family 1 profile domain-containing protein n=1 Tax=Caenorhabditis angaria TaxID=860376 RepID=A0A9P1IHI8_9PELO|nr:unnamed protein product [Caenorhabditis angaria]